MKYLMQFVLILRNEKVQLMEFRSIACNVMPLGDVAKKHTELLRLLQVRKAQTEL